MKHFCNSAWEIRCENSTCWDETHFGSLWGFLLTGRSDFNGSAASRGNVFWTISASYQIHWQLQVFMLRVLCPFPGVHKPLFCLNAAHELIQYLLIRMFVQRMGSNHRDGNSIRSWGESCCNWQLERLHWVISRIFMILSQLCKMIQLVYKQQSYTALY